MKDVQADRRMDGWMDKLMGPDAIKSSQIINRAPVAKHDVEVEVNLVYLDGDLEISAFR